MHKLFPSASKPKAFDRAVLDAMQRLQATVDVLEKSPADELKARRTKRSKILKARQLYLNGEVAEWLKAAVC